MIVVIDTNVIVSATMSPEGNSAEIIRRWEADKFEVATSRPLVAELERVLTYPQVTKYTRLTQEQISALAKRFQAVAIVVVPQISLEVVQEDPDDNRVLECAVAAGASYVVTGDRHLLELKEYEGIVILDPGAFVTLLGLTRGFDWNP